MWHFLLNFRPAQTCSVYMERPFSQTKCSAAQIVGAKRGPVGTRALFVGVPRSEGLSLYEKDLIFTQESTRIELTPPQLEGSSRELPVGTFTLFVVGVLRVSQGAFNPAPSM